MVRKGRAAREKQGSDDSQEQKTTHTIPPKTHLVEYKVILAQYETSFSEADTILSVAYKTLRMREETS